FYGSLLLHVLNSFPTRRSSDLFFATACSSAHGFSGSGQPGGSIMDGGRTTVLIGVGDLTAAARLSLPMGMVFTITSSYPHMNIQDRKSTRLNSSHQIISYAVFF